MPTRTKKKLTPKEHDYLPVFEYHGTSLESSGTDLAGLCPFCEHDDEKFFLNQSTGQWNCKNCGEAGNVYTFLHKHYLSLSDKTDPKKIRSLAKFRNLHPEAIKNAGFAHDQDNNRYILPIFNRRGSLVNLKTYSPSVNGRFYNTPNPITAHIWNSQKLSGADDTIYICEGEWDGIALEYVFDTIPKSRRPEGTVIAVPGADSVTPKLFTNHIISLLQGKRVILVFDHDDAGTRGMNKLAKLLVTNGIPDVHVINWPDSYPTGYDISDHITKTKLPPEKAWAQLEEWIEPISSDVSNINNSSVNLIRELPDLPPRTKFSQVLADYRKYGVSINRDMEGGLALSSAVAISNELPGDPLWLFLVGASGTGKSLILESTMASPNYIYRTTTNYTDLLSGYKGEGSEEATLIRQLIGKTFVIKDYTTILTLPFIDIQKMNGLLRDAYDGSVVRSWGNGLKIEIEGFFSIVAGVTNKIHSHQNSNLGERFLKYEIAPPQGLGNRRAIVQALSGGLNAAGDIQNRKYRQASFCSFTDQLRTRVAEITKKHTFNDTTLSSIISMSQFVSLCRSVVERDRQGALLYEASPEAGTRLAKQLSKLPQALCHVYGLRRPDDHILRIVRKTAWDSAYSRIRSVFSLLYHEPDGLTTNEISEGLALPKSTAQRTLADMHELKIVRRRKNRSKDTSKGRPEFIYKLVREATEIYSDCGFPE